MGVTETIVWNLLRNRVTGFRFRRQHPVGPYFLDFFCREASLALELDGEQHAEQADYDARRDAWLASRGILVIRVPALDFFEANSVKGVKWMEKVEAACAERTRRPSPPTPSPATNHAGEGASN
jgi:very-short-patch-repair endonuclease